MDIDKIKKTFTRANPYPVGMACIISIARYYGEEIPAHWLKASTEDTTLGEIKEQAIQIGFEAKIRLLKMEQLLALQAPTILFLENELSEMGFVVCYGFDGMRFIVGEPTFGLMQYYPKELEMMWIRGIVLSLEPSFALKESTLEV